ncbi:Protein of unknown function [Pontibacter lucknowensis]|uniref:DUF3575 domain-containing protein n=1 Tax=Pontibacter lucknowensis TaxID=1077936 RepID=A0A1N6TGS7_9BACT|nr:Protein of unknown function [Pontibacter lucknowensis]
MKTRCTLALFLFLLITRGVCAQDIEGEDSKLQRPNAFKLNIIPLFIGSFNVSYERHITPHFAGALTATAYPRRLTLMKDDFSSTYAITSDFKFYSKGKSLNGFYAGPYLKYRLRIHNEREGGNGFWLFSEPDREYEQWAGYGAGAIMGYQQVKPKGFTIDLFWGIGCHFHQKLISKSNYTKEEIEYHKPSPYDLRLGMSLGYAF